MIKFIQLAILLLLATIAFGFEIKDGPLVVGNRVKPDASAVLQIESTTQGYLLPRLTSAQRDAVASPAAGLQIYNTTTGQLELFDGASWGSVDSGAGVYEWQPTTAYLVDAIVWEQEKFYKALSSHTSGATFVGDAANWVEMSDDLNRLLVSVDNTLPRFDGTTGDLIQSSNVTISDTDVMGNVAELAVGAAAPDASSIHDNISTTKGARPCPSMTEAQRDLIAAPVGGLCIFNTTTNKLNVYNASDVVWKSAGGGLEKWATGTAYKIDDVIWEAGSDKIYRATADHTAGATFAGDIANWAELSKATFETTVFDSTNEINGPVTHIDTLQETYSHFSSSGIVNGCAITDNADGTVSVALGVVSIRGTADPHTTIYHVNIGASGVLALTDNATNYIYIDYNAGTPQWAVTTSSSTPNGLDKVLAYIVVREGTTLKIIDTRDTSVDIANKANKLFVDFSRYIHAEGGTSLGSTSLALTVSAGKFYYGVNPIPHVAFDTSIAGTANENVFEYYYGSWTEVPNSKNIDNVNYDNAGVLTPLGTGKWKVDWVYILNNSPSSLAVIYGDTQYNNQAAAELAPVPSSVPPSIEGAGSLIGRVLVQEGVGTLVPESAFAISFAAAGVTNHNDLSGLQGGAASEYYHLDATEFSFLDGQNQAVLTTSSPTFSALTLSGLTLGSVPFASTAGLIAQDNTNLFWDNTAKRLGIGINTPSVDLDVAGNIKGEGSKILGNDAYKQYNKSAYAEYSVIGDFTTGQNATFDGGGTITAGEPSIETGALDSTDTKFYQYDMGAVNDYFYFTIPVDQNRNIGYRFRYSYDGANDDMELQIKCSTSGTILTDNSPVYFPATAGELDTLSGSITVPTGCGDLKFGWSVATFNSGKIFKFNRIALTNRPNDYKNLTAEQSIRYDGAGGYGSTNTRIPYFSTATKNTGDSLVSIDNSSVNGFSITALKDCRVHGVMSINPNAADEAGFTLNSSQLSTNIGSVTVTDVVAYHNSSTAVRYSIPFDIKLNAGDVLRPHGSAITYTNLFLEMVAESEAEHVVHASEKRDEWIAFNPTISGVGTPTNIEAFYKRNGDSMDIQLKFVSGTVDANNFYVELPNGYTVNTSVVTSDGVFGVGEGHYLTGASAAITGNYYYGFLKNSDTNKVYITSTKASGVYETRAGNGILSSSSAYSFEFIGIPISGWSGANQYYVAVQNPNGTFNTTEKLLAADNTTAADMSDLTFTGLEVGEKYLLVGQVKVKALSNTNTVRFNSGAGNTGTLYKELALTNSNASQVIVNNGVGVTFTAASASLYVYHGATEVIFGDGTKQETFLQLTKLPQELGVVPGTFAKVRTAYVYESQTSGTAAGASTSTTTHDRVLNTINGDVQFITLATNKFTLQPGKYNVYCTAPSLGADQTRAWLYDFTNTVTAIEGISSYGNTTGGVFVNAVISGSVDITSATQYGVKHYITTGRGGDGLGTAVSQGTEVYTHCKIQQVLAR